MDGLSNNFIDSILISRARYFRGVYSANNISPSLSQENVFSIICNLDEFGEKGSHFVTIICFPKFVLYIDSFGLPCLVKTINIFLKTLNRPIFFNETQIQSNNSNYCGFFTMLFVLYFDLIFTEKTPKKIVFNLSDLSMNDNICVKEIKHILSET